MPRAKTKVERQCLVCDSTFMGTPAATRCDTCKVAGLKVPRDRQVERRKKPEPTQCSKPRTAATKARPKIKVAKPKPVLIAKTCGACGEQFETHKPKAARCYRCIEEDRPVRYKSCVSCGVKFPAPQGDEYHCLSCAEAHGIGQAELTPEQREAHKAAETLARWKNKVAILECNLAERANEKPKRTRKMSNETKESAIGVAWLELCARDGNVSALSQIHESDMDDETKLRLILAFSRIRLRGYTVEAISRLCPVHLMKLDEGKAIDGLPVVENPNPPTPQEMAEIELGLH